MSPTLSSAGGLNARTRATRFSGSKTRTPGVAAKTSPLRSYVHSPGSNSAAPRKRGVEERTVRRPTLRTERRIHEDRLEALANGSDVREAPLDLDLCAFPVPAGGFDRRWIRVQAQHPTGAEKPRGDCEHAV